MDLEYVVCPKRGEARVSLQVCLGVCDSKDDCEELSEVPEKDIDAALARLNNVPVPLADMVIDVGEDGDIVPTEAPKKDAEEASRYLQRAISIKTEIEGKFWEMGYILSNIFKNQYYVDYGYHDWKQFCEEVLEMKWRTATYLRDIYVKFTSLKVRPEDCIGAGWGKLKELLPIVTKENVKYWLAEAKKKKMTVATLNARVRLSLGKITKEEAEKVPQQLVFRLYESQLENVERTLDLARRMVGSDSRGYQLEMICAEFRATYEGQDENYPRSKLISDMLGKIEHLFNVTIKGEVIDATTGELIKETG
jgi:hypothetical protein